MVMKLIDFDGNPKDLIGKLVLHEEGTHLYGVSKEIRPITKVTKTGFKIKGSEQLFRIVDGYAKKSDSSRMNWGTTNKCTLITEDEAAALGKEWREKREIKEIREYVIATMGKLPVNELRAIREIIVNYEKTNEDS